MPPDSVVPESIDYVATSEGVLVLRHAEIRRHSNSFASEVEDAHSGGTRAFAHAGVRPVPVRPMSGLHWLPTGRNGSAPIVMASGTKPAYSKNFPPAGRRSCGRLRWALATPDRRWWGTTSMSWIWSRATDEQGQRLRATRQGILGKERGYCLSAIDGHSVWKHEYDCPYTISYPNGPRTTPTVDGDRVYTLGAMGDLLCFDADTGKVRGRRTWPPPTKPKCPCGATRPIR